LYDLDRAHPIEYHVSIVMRKKSLLMVTIMVLCAEIALGQSLDIPSKHWGISFGNSTEFTGLRFNFRDKNIRRIDGINVSVWHGEDLEYATGKFRGIGIGLPLASGTRYRAGLSIGLFGVAAGDDIHGVNLAGLAIGCGRNLVGVNLAGLAVGCGENVKGVNAALLAVGAGGDVYGINVAGLAMGAGENISGLNIGGLATGAGKDVSGINLSLLAVGSGENMSGISLAGLAIGCGENLTGISFAGLAVGSGEDIKGVSLAGLAVGCGDELTGISAAILAVGAPDVRGLQAAVVVGGEYVKGISLAPAYFRITGNGEMTGLSISAFNHIQGFQRGVAVGIINHTYDIKGLQLGLLNHVSTNPKWAKWLPIFNTRF
jgi:hypothetical protein